MSRMILLALWVLAACASINPARADAFTATYSEPPRSPAGYAASWYSGADSHNNQAWVGTPQ